MVADDAAVGDLQHPAGPLRQVPVMGDEDDGLADGHQLLEEPEDLVGRRRVQVAGLLAVGFLVER